MKKTLNVLGIVGGVLMIASGAMHSLMGWTELNKSAGTKVPQEFVAGLAVPWHYTGLGMVVFGVLAIWFFVQRLRRIAVPAFPAMLVGLFYCAFALIGFLFIKPDPFFAMFGIPGTLVLLGVYGGGEKRPS